jgi:hypothetical protein
VKLVRLGGGGDGDGGKSETNQGLGTSYFGLLMGLLGPSGGRARALRALP